MARIGIDIDGVMADYIEAVRRASADLLNLRLPDQMPPTYSPIGPGWLPDKSAFEKVHAAVTEKVWDKPPLERPGLLSEVTSTLRESGHEVVIITARCAPSGAGYDDAHVQQGTRRWLDAHEVVYDDAIFTAVKYGHGLDLLVDDNPSILSVVRAAGERAVAFDHRYNRSLGGERIDTLAALPALASAIH